MDGEGVERAARQGASLGSMPLPPDVHTQISGARHPRAASTGNAKGPRTSGPLAIAGDAVVGPTCYRSITTRPVPTTPLLALSTRAK
jgi:hypothetical protein